MNSKSFFFCGIGGSGMMPLAMIVRAQGHAVAGSDRSLDQARIPAKFEWLKAQGIELFAQDGSGVTSADQTVIASAAVEDSVPDMVAATRLGCPRMTRAELLAQLFNASQKGIAIGGTSGKSTVTGMVGWIFHALGLDPTVMNGAVMKNFAREDAPFASALVGSGDAFISEVDESDGSIALFSPDVAVLNNVALDHKSMDELRQLFGDFIAKARVAVLNADSEEVMALPRGECVTYSLTGATADLIATDIVERPDGVDFKIGDLAVSLQVPGRHNVANALAALGAAKASGIDLAAAAEALGQFAGLRRRLELVGSANGITVIDDFGHNPDKIAATLNALHAFPGRLLIFFQPHGYGPLRLIGADLARTFRDKMLEDDRLIVSDPAYFGGTVDRSQGSETLVASVDERAEHFADRDDCASRLVALARPGDRIVIMGARDDSLSQFAEDILARL